MRSSVRTSSGRPLSPWTGVARYSVSCMSRAGCSAGMFSASKQCHSSSTSGPSTIAKPMRVKMSSMRSRTMVSGWRWPSAGPRPGSVTSTRVGGPPCRRRRGPLCRRAALRSPLQLVREAAERLRFFRRAAATACIHEATTLFLRPRYRSRTAWRSRRWSPRELRLNSPQPGDRVGVGVRSSIGTRVQGRRSLKSGIRSLALRMPLSRTA